MTAEEDKRLSLIEEYNGYLGDHIQINAQAEAEAKRLADIQQAIHAVGSEYARMRTTLLDSLDDSDCQDHHRVAYMERINELLRKLADLEAKLHTARIEEGTCRGVLNRRTNARLNIKKAIIEALPLWEPTPPESPGHRPEQPDPTSPKDHTPAESTLRNLLPTVRYTTQYPFVRLVDDGDRIVGVFVGMPFVYEVVWSKKNGYEPYDPKEHAGRRPRMRVAMNFFDLTAGTMRIIEGGARWWKNVRAIRAELPFDRWAFEIVRRGGPGDPRTSYSIQPYARLGSSLRAKIETTPVHTPAP